MIDKYAYEYLSLFLLVHICMLFPEPGRPKGKRGAFNPFVFFNFPYSISGRSTGTDYGVLLQRDSRQVISYLSKLCNRFCTLGGQRNCNRSQSFCKYLTTIPHSRRHSYTFHSGIRQARLCSTGKRTEM